MIKCEVELNIRVRDQLIFSSLVYVKSIFEDGWENGENTLFVCLIFEEYFFSDAICIRKKGWNWKMAQLFILLVITRCLPIWYVFYQIYYSQILISSNIHLHLTSSSHIGFSKLQTYEAIYNLSQKSLRFLNYSRPTNFYVEALNG